MPIYTEIKNGKTTYMVVATARIHGKQVNKKKRSITSIAAAKRVEMDFKVHLARLKEQPLMCTWAVWSEKCLKRMRLQFKQSTVVNYQSSFNKWVNPVLGELFLDEIKPSDIHSLVFDKIEGVSLEARHGVLKRLKRVFSMAVEDGIISKNPATEIKVKVPESPQAVLNRTEINTLLYEAKSRKHRYYNHWALALLTGLRKGELIALTWSDIDFENRVIAVTKSWSKLDGIGPTKSTKNRYVPISSELERFLKELRSQSHLNEGQVLEQHKDWLYGDAAKVLKDFCKKIGITLIKFHDLRATFITQMLLKGVAVAKVMKIVGHSSIKTTMRYLRLIAEDTQGATEELGIVLPKTEEKGNLVALFQGTV